MRRIFLTLSLISLALYTGCSHPHKELGIGDHGKTISILPGQKILVKLEEHFTTGYQWLPCAQQNSIIHTVSRPRSHAAPKRPANATGQPFDRYFLVQPMSKREKVCFKYKRSWESTVDDITFEFTAQEEDQQYP